MKYLFLFLVIFIFSCKKKNSEISPNTNCKIPTEINIQNKSGGIVEVSLINADSSVIGKVTWVISSADKSFTLETTGKILIDQQFLNGGEFNATAVIETTCKDKITLTGKSTLNFDPLSITWNKYVGGTDSLKTLIATNDGGYIVGGDKEVYVPVEGQVGSNYVYKAYVIYKINSNGSVEWQKSFQSEGHGFLNAITTTSDGGYLIGGNYFYYPSNGEYDYRVIKINDRGDKLWDKSFGGNGNDNLNYIKNTADGGFLLLGNSTSEKSRDKSEGRRDIGYGDAWIVKINSSGIKEWDKTYGGSGSDDLKSVIEYGIGGFLLTGSSSSNKSGDKSEDSRGLSDYWVVKINNKGQKEWDKTFGGYGPDYAQSSFPTLDGGTILGGTSYSNYSGDKTAASKGDSDYWVVKINAQGQKVWDKTIGGNLGDYFLDFVAENNDIILAGSSSSNISFDNTSNKNGKYSIWLVKLSVNGDKIWDQSLNDSKGNGLKAIQLSKSKGYIMLGSSDGTFGDSWIIKAE